MKILILGASGMVGQGVLRECLIDARVSAVSSVVRAPIGKPHPKLTEIVVPDMFQIAHTAPPLCDFDACFFCVGMYSFGMSEAQYTHLTYNLTMTIANALAPCNPGMVFIYVSGAGTNRQSRQMWSRVKARTEDALMALPFKAAYAFRPGFIQPLHGVVSRMRWAMAIFTVTRLVSPLLTRWFPSVATTSERVGCAMIYVAAKGYPKPVLESIDINRAAWWAELGRVREPNMPTLMRVTCVVVLVGMASLIAYGFFYQDAPGQVAASMVPFWGKFVWTDVTATFLLFAIVIFAYERSPLLGVAMLVLMNLFGAAAIAAWLLWRGADLYRRIRA